MLKFIRILILFVFSIHMRGLSQENNIWVFGHNVGLDVSTANPIPIVKQIGSNEGCASVSNAKGQLLFYCIGSTIWNQNGQVMANGSNIVSYPTIGATQGALIAPVLNSPNKYYVFSLEQMESYLNNNVPRACRLSYCIVDLQLNHGLGDVVAGVKGILLDSNLTEKMIAVPGSDCNIWLLLHRRGRAEFIAYSITESGISQTPVISVAGNLHGNLAHLSGVMKISPDRKRLLLCSAGDMSQGISGATGVELFQFDPSIGSVGNVLTIDSTDFNYGGCFSPDGNKIYVSGDFYQVHGSFVRQYDISSLNAVAVRNSKIDMYQYPYPGYVKPTDLKIANDSVLYLNSFSSLDFLDKISQPNAVAVPNMYHTQALQLLPNTTGDYGLPNEFVKPVIRDTFYSNRQIVLCKPNPDSVLLHARTSEYFFEWNDMGSDSTKVVYKPGTYWCRSRNYCHLYIDTFTVIENDITFDLGNDTTMCGDSLLLKLPIKADAYRWQDGSKEPFYLVKESGQYAVTIDKGECVNNASVNISLIDLTQHLSDTAVCRESPINIQLHVAAPIGSNIEWSNHSNEEKTTIADTGTYWVAISKLSCAFSDTFHVRSIFCDCRIFFPSAFTPNGDGKNDIFRMCVEANCPIDDFHLSIFDRWGNCIYRSSDYHAGWHGLLGNEIQPGVYMYEADFLAGNLRERHFVKGDVTLIK